MEHLLNPLELLHRFIWPRAHSQHLQRGRQNLERSLGELPRPIRFVRTSEASSNLPFGRTFAAVFSYSFRHVKTPIRFGQNFHPFSTSCAMQLLFLSSTFFFFLEQLLFPKISLTSHLFIPFISVKESGRLLNPIMF